MEKIENLSSKDVFISGRRGQGTIEYVLLLVITIALIMSLVAQFSKPFQDYVGNAMGTYIACLLETGELPNLGGNSGEALCKAPEFGPGGRANATAGNRGGAGSGAGASDKGNGAADSGSSSEDSSSGGGGSTVAGASSRSGGGRSFIRNFKSNSNRGSDGNKVSQVISEDESSSGAFFSNRNSGNYRNGVRRKPAQYVAIRGAIYDEQIKKARQEANRNRAVLSQDEGGSTLASKRTILKPPEAKKTGPDKADEALSLGDYLRYLIIAAIVIAIVVFIGGQAMSLSSSD